MASSREEAVESPGRQWPLFVASAGLCLLIAVVLVAAARLARWESQPATASAPAAPARAKDSGQRAAVAKPQPPHSPVDVKPPRPAVANQRAAGPPAPAAPRPPAPAGLADLPAPPGAQCQAPTDRRYGTAVDFVDDPTEAAAQALRQKKLLFVLHIAGNFEDAKFT